MVVGLTVVSIGTSLPELAIGIDAARSGSPALAVGNIVGTNLVNLLFILGLSALLVPIAFERRTLRFDLPAMVVAALALYALARDGVLARADGILLVLGGVVYTSGVLYVGRRDPDLPAVDGARATPEPSSRVLRLALELVVGLVVIVVGAELLVEGAVDGAQALGVSEAVVGLTIIAIGTSAPELVTTLVSTIRGKRDLAIGNLLGSSVYNIAVVLGVTCVVAPTGVPVPAEVLASDLVLLAVATVVAVPVLLTGARISRAEGGLFVAAYLAYLGWLRATRAS
ncbi:MAG TPA: calcium/sodium antiporter [Actinomycetota bacterium]|jgi:cation:H+ antiporter|nr:calcium/sodium antiporter [Actinomycetota bacterium]